MAAVAVEEIFNMKRRHRHRNTPNNVKSFFWQDKIDLVKKLRDDQIAEGRRMMKAELLELEILDNSK